MHHCLHEGEPAYIVESVRRTSSRNIRRHMRSNDTYRHAAGTADETFHTRRPGVPCGGRQSLECIAGSRQIWTVA